MIESFNVPIVTDKKVIEKVTGKKIEFHGNHPKDEHSGNGWYSRDNKFGSKLTKILVGRPKV